MTLIEVLIALAVLTILIAVAYGAIAQGVKVQSGQEAATSTQARLRRITEVFTQELRSAVLGAVSNTPYASGSSAVSFALLDGGAGFQVTGISAANNRLSVATTASSGSQLSLEGEAMVVDAGGQAVIFPVRSVSISSPGTATVETTAAGCFAGLSEFSEVGNRNALLFDVKTMGLRYAEDEGILYLKEGQAEEQALAFDLSQVSIDYVYQENGTGNLHSLATPLLENEMPARNAVIGDEQVQLVRLQIALEGEAGVLGGIVSRNYLSQVELGANPSFNVKVVRSCG